MKLKYLLLFICLSNLLSAKAYSQNKPFSFVFCTDAHLEYEGTSLHYFNIAIDTINKIKPDFVIAGGDMVRDTNNERVTYADSLYNLYLSEIKKINAPVYTVIGNHDLLGIGKNSVTGKDNPMYGRALYKEKIGKPYYSFEYKGWKFFVIDNLKVIEDEHRVVGHINTEQTEWMRQELAVTDTTMPITVCCHIPIMTTVKQFQLGTQIPTPDFASTDNSMAFFDLFKGYNLRLILQGHEHYFEVIHAMDMYIVTGSTVSSHWWVKPPLTRGIVQFNLSGDDVSYSFIPIE